METPAPPGAAGHGSGLTSIRRKAGKVYRSGDTDEWVIRFEVICPDCGDDGGPFEDQPDAVQQVRGPYRDTAQAREAVQRHTGAA